MGLSEFALALFALMGTLLVPFFVLYQMLRMKRRGLSAPACPAARSAAPEGSQP